MKINITIDGSSEECANFIKAFLSEDADLQQVMTHFVNKGLAVSVGEGADSGDENGQMPNPFETVSWSSIQLYHIILLHHSAERHDCFVMTEDELANFRVSSCGATFAKEQLSRITGGARQTTNVLKVPPILEIKNVGSAKEYCASKKALDNFNAFLSGWHSAYRKELEERGFYFPGEEVDPPPGNSGLT